MVPRCSIACTLLLVSMCARVFAGIQSEQTSATELVKSTLDSVVLIVVSDESGKEVTLGSGFIVSPDGRIVTNYHVIKDAQRAIVRLANGAYFPVETVLTKDSEKDLAILKVGGKNLPFLKLADSDKASIGEHVFAIGSPLGLQNSVSDGIVSGVRDEKPGVSWIQTTAPASPGNSGGPLLRTDGGVLGVITWAARNGQNLNFAAPANEINALLLAADHPIQRPTALSGTAATANGIRELKDVKTIAVASFGNTDAAALVREKLINRIAASGKLTVVESPEDADAVLTGAVGADIYNRASTAAARLTTKDGRVLWAGEARWSAFARSTSSSIADHLAKQFLQQLR